MKAFIERKIGEIRQEPEYVRTRYVWIAVTVVMSLIFIFWVVSLRDNFRRSSEKDARVLRTVVPSSVTDLKDQGQSVMHNLDEAKSLYEEGLSGAAQE
ncbi:MAG: hypothetical protein HGB34_01000 [Candidatus Moranbacteria bacterium]|nr:hypothetical protein [Candidatus Moranbacteria bacterium]NTW75459.1 hypothetical protein [Candidatus Moranbacteria bacterium]